MNNNNYLCSVCGGTDRKIVNGMSICTKCGAAISRDIDTPHYRVFRELGGIKTTSIEFKIYRIKRRLYEICDELNIPPHVRENAFKVALDLIRSGHLKMKATTLSIISLLYTTKLMGNVVLYEKMKKYADKYRGGRHRIGKKKHNIFLSIGWKEPRFNALTYITLIAKRVTQLKDIQGRYGEKYIRSIVKKALKMYISNRMIFIGKKPSTVAAILLYLAEEQIANIGRGGDRLFNLDALSEAAGVSKNTMKNRVAQYRRLLRLR